MPDTKPKIFISYAHRDGKDLARRLEQDLSHRGFDVWLERKRLKPGASWTREIEQEIDCRDLVLALLSQGSYESDICRAEQLRALRKGKKVWSLLVQRNADRPLHLETRQHLDFSNPENYKRAFGELLEWLSSGEGYATLAAGYESTYVTAPPLPPNYIPRPEALESLRARLIRDAGGPAIGLTALRGMGGIGKTVLAQALCHDEVVQQAFPDGVLWVHVGRDPVYDLATRLKEVRRALGDEPHGRETELECINRYRTLMRERAVLVVVDDFWRAEDVEPFRAESPRSRLLFTTRNAEIVRALGAEEHVAELLSEEQAWRLFAHWAGLGEAELPPEGKALVAECSGLPLALAIAGAMVRAKPLDYWRHVLQRLKAVQIDRLAVPLGHYPYPAVYRAIDVSVEELDEKTRQRYLALAVMPEDMAIEPAIQQVLWETDEAGALETRERLIDLSLATREGESAIRLHDLQMDYLRARHQDQETLELMRSAVRLSAHVLVQDPGQFAPQVIGRLLPYQDRELVARFIEQVARSAPRPWLRPLKPALIPPGTGLIRIFHGGWLPVRTVAVTPDGKRVVSGSLDGTIRVWDVASGKELARLEDHEIGSRTVAVTPGRQRVVSALMDGTVRVWDAESREELARLIGHGGWVLAVAATPDAKRVVSGSADGTVRVWDLKSRKQLVELQAREGELEALTVSPDGQRVVSGSAVGTIRLWDANTGSQVAYFTCDSGVSCCAFAGPDVIIAGDESGQIHILKLEE